MKIGLALGGGGVKGMAHTGIFRVLEAERVPIDLIAGTSAGAIVGALYAAGKPAQEIQDLVRKLRIRHWFARDATGYGLFSTDGIRRIIDDALGKGARIEELSRPFMAVAVDMDTRQEVVFDSGSVADAVCASSAYPGLYAPVRIGDRRLFDGGVLNPVPFDIARRRGAHVVLAVDLGAQDSGFGETPSLPEMQMGGLLGQLVYSMAHQRAFRVMERSLAIMGDQIAAQKRQTDPPDVTIYPAVKDIGLLDFHLSEACFAAGEQATLKVLGEIRAAVHSPRYPGRWGTFHKLNAQLRSALGMRRAGGF